MAEARIERATRDHLLAGLVALTAAALLTWPLARDASDHVLWATYHWDAFTNTMILGARVDAVLGRAALSLYDNYFFAPLPESIVFNENLFGLSLLFAPLYLVSGNPLWAYNCTLILSLALSAFITYLLVRRLSGSGLAGILAGVAFACSPYALFEVGRIQLVATQWIPACFLFLHRALETRRLREVIGLGLCYLMQIGTCLYYAMFLIPLLGLAAAVLLVRHRASWRLVLSFAGVGLLCSVVAFAMVHPYFTAREHFALERSLAFASSYDGELSFFGNVHPTNRTWSVLHHPRELGIASEEIAFPGGVSLVLTLLSLGVPLWSALRAHSLRGLALAATRSGVIVGVAALATLLAHDMLVGAGIALVGFTWLHRGPGKGGYAPFAGQRGLYLGLLVLAVLLFLGLSPLTWNGEPVRGLYYYLHTYIPGFNGIRKVSRLAVMTTFVASILASFGSTWLLGKVSNVRGRRVVFAALLGATCYELRSYPHPLFAVWAAEAPDAYRFMASLPAEDLVATVPQDAGARRFQRDAGLALHNYLMLHHKHRSLNGQSSWQPTATVLANRALNHLPSDTSRRVLSSLGARHLLVHADDLGPSQRDLPAALRSRPEHYRRVFEQGPDSVFTLLGSSDPTLALVETPPLPVGAAQIPAERLTARASHRSELAGNAVDGNPETYWTPQRPQQRGQYFEVVLPTPSEVVALEIENRDHETDVPLSYQIEAALGTGAWQVVASQPRVRVYRDLVFSPKTFVLRVAFTQATRADRIRLTLAEPMVGRYLTLHDVRLYMSTR